MNRSQHTYLGIAAVCALSGAMVLWLPSGELIQIIAAVPLVGSLVAALLQILRDQAAHDRQMLIQDSQNRFSLGATSHMANVAFDKHVNFSEEYVAEVHKTLRTLFQEGPTEEVFKHTAALYSTQQKFAVWLTPQIETDLELFESALRNIGANAGYIRNTANTIGRQERVAEMYKTFASVMGSKWMGTEWNGEKLTEELAITMVIRRLRSILGTEELTAIRTALLSKARSVEPTGG
ncbi:MAG: hypothetical protein PSX71_12250 [bacterium]|nr:hypothetical protein [bacterium]